MTSGFALRPRPDGRPAERIIGFLLFAVCLLYIGDWAWKVFWLIRAPYPTEYRDLATIQLTELFSRRVNPYSPESSPPFFYLYGFLFSLVVSLLARLQIIALLPLHKVATLLCVLAYSLLVSLEVRRQTRSLLLQAFAFALMLTTSWNTALFIVRPDSFGLLIVLFVPFILRRSDSFAAIVLCAFLTLAAFYAKQYYLFIAAPVFLYLLFRNWRKAVLYGACVLLLGAGSFLLVRAVFPVFFYASLIAQANSVGGPFHYLLLQTAAFLSRTWPLLLLSCYPVGRKLVWAGARTEDSAGGQQTGEPGLGLYYAILLFAAVCLFVLGKNTGAWLSYYYQLAMPPLVILGLSSLARIEKWPWRTIFLFLIAATSLFAFPRKFDFHPPVTRKDLLRWERAYALLDRYRSSQMMLSPIFADYICRNGLEPVDNGNTQYIENLRIEKRAATMEVLGLLLPDSEGQYDRYAAWRAELAEKVRKQEYSLVAVASNYHPLLDRQDLERSYHRIDEADLRLAGDKSWRTEFWIPNR